MTFAQATRTRCDNASHKYLGGEESSRSAHRRHFWTDSTRATRGGAKTAAPQDQIQPANAYAAMRRPLLPLLLAAAAGWQPHQSCRRPTTRLDLQPPTEAPPATKREGWFGFGDEDDGALLSKAENWFQPKNHYTVEKGDTSHYAVLGVERDATDLEIKRAYRRQSKTCHPDVDPSDEGRERFDAVTLAYETLKDAKKRDAYDGALQVERIAADAEAWIDSVAVPFLRDSAMPTLSDFTKRVETATENVTLAQAAAAAAWAKVTFSVAVSTLFVKSDNVGMALSRKKGTATLSIQASASAAMRSTCRAPS